jgi:Ca2+-binding RTX toxin-like protein
VQQLVEGVPTLTPVGTSGNDDIFAVANTPFSGRNNIIFTGLGNDTIDLATVAGSTIAGNNRIDAGSGKDIIFVNKNDRLFGGVGDDTFEASDSQGGNRMSGGAGDDTFFLGFGDRAIGGDGDDKFFVGTGGNNLISGGAGADQFWIFGGEAPSTKNTILDFTVGTDVIGLIGSGATFAQLTRTGNDISLVGKVLATLTGIDTTSLTASSFAFV